MPDEPEPTPPGDEGAMPGHADATASVTDDAQPPEAPPVAERVEAPSLFDTAKSGRARCRGCGEPISKGTLRFGEGVPNSYGEGEAYLWFHPLCAACMRPEKVRPLLQASDLELQAREELLAFTEEGHEHPRLTRLARAERASTGRAHCRECRQLIEKGAFRIALVIFEEPRFAPLGFLHLGCGEAYFGTPAFSKRLLRLSSKLGPEERAALTAELAGSG
jgi:hypothetical protein